MILVREESVRAHVASGAWGRVTLAEMLGRLAATNPSGLALQDAPGRTAWTTGRPQRFTWAEADRHVAALASVLAGLGLPRDSVILTQLPPTSDAVLFIFAAWRAGLIVAPVPLAFRETELIEAGTLVGAKAIATVSLVEGELLGERVREVAADLFAIRHILGVGGDLPDGFLDLDGALVEAAALEAPDPAEGASDHVALVTFANASGYPVAVARSHNHLVAAGLGMAMEGRMADGAVLHLPLAPSGLAAFATAIVPWLLTGGTLVLDGPRTSAAWAATIGAHEVTHAIAPAILGESLAGALAAADTQTTLVLTSPGETRDLPSLPSTQAAVDVVVLDEFAAVPRRRVAGGTGAPLRPGPWPQIEGLPVLVEIELASNGARRAAGISEIAVRGAMVPDLSWPTSSGRSALWGVGQGGFVPTGLKAAPAGSDGGIAAAGPAADVLTIGRHFAAGAELDSLARAVAGVADAAVFIGSTGALTAAVVPADGIAPDAVALHDEFERLRIGEHRIPRAVHAVAAIPRDADDRPDRLRLAAALPAA